MIRATISLFSTQLVDDLSVGVVDVDTRDTSRRGEHLTRLPRRSRTIHPRNLM